MQRMAEPDTHKPKGVLICANPFSGTGPNRRYVDGLVDALKARGLEPKLVWDLQERDELLSSTDLAGWCRCVVVAGGDGTIGSVVNEMCRARAERPGVGLPGVKLPGVATIPMGNENLFAKYFGFTRDSDRLAVAIEACRTRRIDLGRMTRDKSGQGGYLFTLMGGIGFDADVVHRMQRWRETHKGLRRVNRLSYLPRMLSALLRYRYPRVRIEVDGEQLTGAHLFVFNIPAYGGGLKLAPDDSAADDGQLDWVLFERGGMWAMLKYGLAVLAGRHLRLKDVKHGRAEMLRVLGPAGASIQLDGDPGGVAPVTFRIERRTNLELLITDS